VFVAVGAKGLRSLGTYTHGGYRRGHGCLTPCWGPPQLNFITTGFEHVSYMANEPKIRDEYDRDRGIFTPRDRRFLAGLLEDELSDNEKRQKRYRLRKRMTHALQDLAYLRVLSTEDMGQLAEQFGHGVGADQASAETRDQLHDRFRRFGDGAFEVALFAGELMGDVIFYEQLEGLVANKAAVDHYEETGEFGVFEAEFTVDAVEEISIDELEELVDNANDRSELDELPPGAIQVLGLSGPPFDPDGAPRHPELIEVVKTTVDALTEESDTANRREVVERVADSADVSLKTAREAYADAYFAGECYEPYPEKVAPV
jgi:hypothetical protein